MSDSRFDDSDRSPAAEPPGKSPFATGSPFAEYCRPPRLGIIHLLAWTAATAVLLKLSMAMEMVGDAGGGSMRPSMRVFQQIIGFIYSTAFAAGIVGAGILLSAKVRRVPGRLQPGHWLLLVATVAWLLFLSIQCVFVLAVSTRFEGSSVLVWLLAAYGVVEILCGGMYSYVTLVSRHGTRWRICFASVAVVNSIQGLLYLAWSLSSSPFWSLIVGPVLLITVLVDLRRGPRRDWLHWLGVAIFATGVFLAVAWWVWLTFAMRWME